MDRRRAATIKSAVKPGEEAQSSQRRRLWWFVCLKNERARPGGRVRATALEKLVGGMAEERPKRRES